MSDPNRCTLLVLGLLGCCLVGCGYFDAQQSYVPEILRAKKPDPDVPDPEPDASAVVEQHRSRIFAGEVADLRVGSPKPVELHWEVCVAASVKGATGDWADAILIVEIKNGQIGSRRRATEADRCDVGI